MTSWHMMRHMQNGRGKERGPGAGVGVTPGPIEVEGKTAEKLSLEHSAMGKIHTHAFTMQLGSLQR